MAGPWGHKVAVVWDLVWDSCFSPCNPLCGQRMGQGLVWGLPAVCAPGAMGRTAVGLLGGDQGTGAGSGRVSCTRHLLGSCRGGLGCRPWLGVLAAPHGHPCRSWAPFPLPFVSISGLLQPPLPAATEPLPFPW